MPDNAQAALQSKLAALREKFETDFAERMQRIESMMQSLQDHPQQAQQIDELHRLVHSLVGSCGTFGMMEASQRARSLEQTLKQVAENHHLDADLYDRMLGEFAHLKNHDAPADDSAINTSSTQQSSHPAPSEDSSVSLPITPMSILVADDDPILREHLQLLLEKQGHQVFTAEDGVEAIRLFEIEEPDAVFLDVIMPEMNGYEAAKKIKEMTTGRFTPVLFLSALHEESNLLMGIKQGGDDFLTKPINENLLTMRLYAMQRIKKVHLELEKYQLQTEQEIRTSQHVFDHITQRAECDIDGITTTSASASHFCGDLLLYNNDKHNRHYIMHGDFTGHGLSAAIGAIPVSDIFYGMSERGAKISSIAKELNTKLNHLMPVGKFFACILCCIDLDRNELDLWVGGMPPILAMNRHNEMTHIKADKLALGIMPPDSFNNSCQSYPLGALSSLLFYTDGVTEAWNNQQEMYGEERLDKLFTEHASNPGLIDTVKRSLSDFTEGKEFDDDVSLTFLSIPQIQQCKR